MSRYIKTIIPGILMICTMYLISAHQEISSPKVFSYNSVDTKPVLIKRVTPEYPQEAINKGLEGTVILKLTVGIDGHVHEVKVLNSTDKIFEKPAVDAVKRYIFTPAQKDGQNVSASMIIPVVFKMKK